MVTGDSGAPGKVARNHVDLEQDPDQETVTILLQSSEEETAFIAAQSGSPATSIRVH